MISPSSIIVDSQGRFIPKDNLNEIVEKGLSGLDPQSEFAPLPLSFQELYPELGKEFVKAYSAYYKNMIQPLFDWMAQAGQLVILIDLTTVLAAGVGMYNTNLKLLDLLFAYLKPGRNQWSKCTAFLSRRLSLGRFRFSGITRIAVVATKIDKIHASQRQKALFLLRDMLENKLREYKLERSLRLEYFTCAAVRATSSEKNGRLKGRLQKYQGRFLDPKNAPFYLYEASNLPDKWPESWAKGEYCFPNVLPSMPERKDRPPEHLNLDLVADFMLKKDNWYE
jgi:predicted YcjX-like family ATPase